MKIKLLSAILVAAAMLWQVDARAQSADSTETTNPAQSDLKALVEQVNAKIEAGKTAEADYADELKSFDTLIAKDKAAGETDVAAQTLYMKAQLYLEVFNDFDKAKELFAQIKTDYPTTPYGQHADEIIKGIDQQAAAKKIQDALVAGSTFPDFTEKDLDGQPISVGALKGKVVLVDFWATWCGPCRGELPNVIATYQKHHADGFDIIGVSLDSDRNQLNTFIKQQDGMTWPQFFDGQQWQNKLAVKYGVMSIPFAVLIGPDGKIIAKDLRGEELENAVAAALTMK